MKTFLLFISSAASLLLQAQSEKKLTHSHGAVVRGDTTKKELSLVLTADETGEGLAVILQILKDEKIKAGFFFTGRFYRNPLFQKAIQQAKKNGHYLGPYSDGHLLYCDWNKRDSLLVTKDSFETDMLWNLEAMKAFGINHSKNLFIPPFEWWNDSIASWCKENRLLLFNFTPGIRTNVDYTWPEMGASYKSSEWIMRWLKDFVETKPSNLNGAIILLHAGTDARRKDKFYNLLREMIHYLKQRGYRFKRVDELIATNSFYTFLRKIFNPLLLYRCHRLNSV